MWSYLSESLRESAVGEMVYLIGNRVNLEWKKQERGDLDERVVPSPSERLLKLKSLYKLCNLPKVLL